MDIGEWNTNRALNENEKKEMLVVYEYLRKTHIQELMNEMLTHIVHEKPEDVKKFMVQLLKKAKKDENGHCRLLSDFIKKDDYDAMFDSYDILNLKAIPFCYLLQALEVIGVPDPEFVMEQKYPEVKPDSTIGKKQFVTILSREQRRYGYSFTVE